MATIIRGTTPTFQLTINDQSVDLTEADNVYVTIEQGSKSITKTGSSITVAARQVDVFLSQAETIKFVKGEIELQINWTYSSGERAATKIKKIEVDDNLAPEVLA